MKKINGVVLFSGNTNNTLTLTDSAANNDYIEIYHYIDLGGIGYMSTKVYSPNNKNVNLGGVHRDLTQSVLFFITSMFKISGNQMTFLASGLSHMYTGDSTNLSVTDKKVYITRVVGYKM